MNEIEKNIFEQSILQNQMAIETATTPRVLERAGRKGGVPNKITGQLRQFVQIFLEERKEDLIQAWDELSAERKVMAFEKLAQYAIPKLNAVQYQEVKEDGLDVSRLTDDELKMLLHLQNKARVNEDGE